MPLKSVISLRLLAGTAIFIFSYVCDVYFINMYSNTTSIFLELLLGTYAVRLLSRLLFGQNSKSQELLRILFTKKVNRIFCEFMPQL